MDIKLIAIDIDGTLVNSKKELLIFAATLSCIVYHLLSNFIITF